MGPNRQYRVHLWVLTDITEYTNQWSLLLVLTDVLYISVLGDGWAPTILETEDEYDFVKLALVYLENGEPIVVIGGSPFALPADLTSEIDYSQYSTKYTGTEFLFEIWFWFNWDEFLPCSEGIMISSQKRERRWKRNKKKLRDKKNQREFVFSLGLKAYLSCT